MKYSLEEAARKIGVPIQDILGFLEISYQIKKDKDGLCATYIGTSSGCLKRSKSGIVLTKKGFNRISNVFDYKKYVDYEVVNSLLASVGM